MPRLRGSKGGKLLAYAERTSSQVITTSTDLGVSVTFVVPASGKVRFTAHVPYVQPASLGGIASIQITTSANVEVALGGATAAVANQLLMIGATRLLSGLTPGATVTYKLRGAITAAGGGTVGGSATAPLTLLAYDGG